MTEIRECPFCGQGDGIIIDVFDDDPKMVAICCSKCAAEGPPRATEDEAVIAWNTRAS